MKKVINYGLCHLLVSWYFEPSQPQRIMSGLKTNFHLFPSYSVYKSLNNKFLKSQLSVKYFTKKPTQHTSYLIEHMKNLSGKVITTSTISECQPRKIIPHVLKPNYIPWPLNTGTCLIVCNHLQGDPFYSVLWAPQSNRC